LKGSSNIGVRVGPGATLFTATAAARERPGRVARERDDGPLAGRVGGRPREPSPELPGHAGDGADPAPRLHPPGGLADAEVGPQDVHLEDPPEGRGRDVHEGRRVHDAGANGDAVDLAQGAEGLVEGRGDVGLVHHIDPARHVAGPRAVGHTLGPLAVEIQAGDAVPLPRQHPDGGGSDAAGRTDHDCRPVPGSHPDTTSQRERIPTRRPQERTQRPTGGALWTDCARFGGRPPFPLRQRPA